MEWEGGVERHASLLMDNGFLIDHSSFQTFLCVCFLGFSFCIQSFIYAKNATALCGIITVVWYYIDEGPVITKAIVINLNSSLKTPLGVKQKIIPFFLIRTFLICRPFCYYFWGENPDYEFAGFLRTNTSLLVSTEWCQIKHKQNKVFNLL